MGRIVRQQYDAMSGEALIDAGFGVCRFVFTHEALNKRPERHLHEIPVCMVTVRVLESRLADVVDMHPVADAIRRTDLQETACLVRLGERQAQLLGQLSECMDAQL